MIIPIPRQLKWCEREIYNLDFDYPNLPKSTLEFTLEHARRELDYISQSLSRSDDLAFVSYYGIAHINNERPGELGHSKCYAFLLKERYREIAIEHFKRSYSSFFSKVVQGFNRKSSPIYFSFEIKGYTDTQIVSYEVKESDAKR